jgi:hypothetical protein
MPFAEKYPRTLLKRTKALEKLPRSGAEFSEVIHGRASYLGQDSEIRANAYRFRAATPEWDMCLISQYDFRCQ